MTFRVHIHIVPRKGLLDPQGKAVADALHSLGFASVRDVRIGRHIVVEAQREPRRRRRAGGGTMCERLLANPVTEDFAIEHVEAGHVKFGIVTFPGSNCDDDTVHAVTDELGATAVTALAQGP